MDAQTHLTQRLMDNLTNLVNDASERGCQTENISIALAATLGRVIGSTSDSPEDADSSVDVMKAFILDAAKSNDWPERKDNEV